MTTAQTTIGLVTYYAKLLVRQYSNKPKAVATIETSVVPVIMPQTTVETITFSPVPTAGAFLLTYGDSDSFITVNWNDSAATIQAALRMLPPETVSGGDAATAEFTDVISGGNADTTIFQNLLNGGNAYGFNLSQIMVTGSIASGTLTITFFGIVPPAGLLDVLSSTLTNGSTSILPIVTETDLTLPLAVQAGYQVTGSPATGVQLDVLAKYAGVTRTGYGFTAQITLDDADFLSLIQMAIIKNNSGSSLATIQALLFQFFPLTVTVVDYANMNMAFYISSAVASEDLVELFVTENVLPVPMAVGYSVISYDALNAFGFEGSVHSGGFGDLSDSTIGGMFASLFYSVG